PHTTEIGIAYMLQGGAVADNSDPNILTPPPGQDWQVDPPHVMLIFPQKLDLSKYPTRPGGSLPWVMFAGTPYEHMMVPIPAALPKQGKGRVANAMSAGPDELGRHAAIADWPTSGTNFKIVRRGSNGWTCVPDDIAMQPHTLTDDPMCLDQPWFEWISASLAGRNPQTTRPGIGYMLQGGSEGSNTDPAAVEPPDGHSWQIDPPHIMVILPTPIDQAQVGTDPRYGRPWVMFADTPFEHIMIPVR
ncbi:MAG TPA: hypothetical protein VFT99_01525, partial [Roseiflexaceae bacterium]|nr:hypothetical protein [Roseiflexaceae bacterium]